MFKALLASVLRMLGISSFDKKDGKSFLTEDQKNTLKDKYGEKFLNQFLIDLAKYEEENADASGEDVLAIRERLDALQAKYDEEMNAAREREKNLNDLVESLSNSPEAEVGSTGAAATSAVKRWSPDMRFKHNSLLQEAFDTGNFAILSDATIDTTDIRTEFGKYVSDQRREIITLLFGKLQCTEFMTTKMTDKTEWQAMQNTIQDLIQKFTPYYTPSGKVKFTPVVIVNRKHKINVPVKPAEIMEDVIGYLYDEGLQPKDMPIVRYIIEVLLKPKVEEERDEMLGVGVYDSTKNADKTDNDAGDVGGSMDGFVTILRNLHANANMNIVRLLQVDGVSTALTDENIYDQFNKIYLQIPKKYRNKKFFMHIDPDLLHKYDLARDAKFPNLSNENEGKRRLIHTNFVFNPLDCMTGTGVFFITPKENFIHLLSKNRGATKIFAQAENYDVKIFAEWWEATGFAIAELIFAYVPPIEESSGSGSASASGSGSASASGSGSASASGSGSASGGA